MIYHAIAATDKKEMQKNSEELMDDQLLNCSFLSSSHHCASLANPWQRATEEQRK